MLNTDALIKYLSLRDDLEIILGDPNSNSGRPVKTNLSTLKEVIKSEVASEQQPKVWAGILLQDSTDDPSIQDWDGDPVTNMVEGSYALNGTWARTDTGTYVFTPSGSNIVPVNKTTVTITPLNDQAAEVNIVPTWTDETTMRITSGTMAAFDDDTTTLADSLMQQHLVVITVYP